MLLVRTEHELGRGKVALTNLVASYIREAGNWVWNNKQWLFDGAGGVLLLSVAARLWARLVPATTETPLPPHVPDVSPAPQPDVTTESSYRMEQFQDGTASVEGTLYVGSNNWHSVVKLPAFEEPPTIALFPKGRASGLQEPEVRKGSITTDRFIVDITSSTQQGEWEWRARGTLKK